MKSSINFTYWYQFSVRFDDYEFWVISEVRCPFSRGRGSLSVGRLVDFLFSMGLAKVGGDGHMVLLLTSYLATVARCQKVAIMAPVSTTAGCRKKVSVWVSCESACSECCYKRYIRTIIHKYEL